MGHRRFRWHLTIQAVELIDWLKRAASGDRMKQILKKLPLIGALTKRLNNLTERTEWVASQLALIPTQNIMLDAGCGDQQYRKYATHLVYKAQDFGQYTFDEKNMLGSVPGGAGGDSGYKYGHLDYTGNIWDIAEKNSTFDVILCTEVFEHVPYPIETLKEFSRLLKPGGRLILTAPSNCLRHMDPYFFYSGFSDRWYEKFLPENDFSILSIEPVGDYYSWLAVEMARAGVYHGLGAKALLLPAFLYFYMKKKTPVSVNTLCMGYHVVAIRI